jgi:iron complex transport system ATP-binding protein
LLKAGTIIAEGSPAEVLTESSVREVFGVACSIITDPESGGPLCIPLMASRKV